MVNGCTSDRAVRNEREGAGSLFGWFVHHNMSLGIVSLWLNCHWNYWRYSLSPEEEPFESDKHFAATFVFSPFSPATIQLIWWTSCPGVLQQCSAQRNIMFVDYKTMFCFLKVKIAHLFSAALSEHPWDDDWVTKGLKVCAYWLGNFHCLMGLFISPLLTALTPERSAS